MQTIDAKSRYRTIFLSDVHLGTKGCRSDFLLDFLRRTDCEQLYLVGDIIDGWRLRKSWYWTAEFDEVLREILTMARRGVAVTYIPGNHDEMFRDWLGLGFEVAGVRMARDTVHEGADGRRYLVIHGDEFDGVIRYAKVLAHLGDWAYDWALTLNRVFNGARRRLGYPYWSLSQWLKRQVKAR
jgi:UDP-2,3-diacylglucosamine pyrophosphatase LpxH